MKIALTFLAALISLFAACQTMPPALPNKIDSIFKSYDDKTRPGCAVLIVKDYTVIFKKGYGMASLEYNVPITPESVFDIASVSKQFTGYAISTLIQAGKISPDDDIHKYLPDVPDFGKFITVRNLIHHTSGLRDWPEALYAAGWRWEEGFQYSDIIRMVRQQKELDFDPGTEYQYSNTGYNLLAAIVAKVTGEPFAQWIKAHIFTPLGMNSSQVLGDYSDVVKNLAASYYFEGTAWHKASDQLTAWGSSSIYTTVEDLAKWVVYFEKGLDNNDPVIMRMTETDKLNNAQPINYAYGLGVSNKNGVKNILHNGGWASYATIISNYPGEKLSIILLSNNGAFSPNQYERAVASLFLKSDLKKEPIAEDLSDKPTIQVDTALLKKYIGTYKLGQHWFVTFTLENGRMMAQANGEDKFPADMKTEDVMWVPSYNSSVTFLNVTDKAGAIKYKNNVSPRVQPVDTAGINLAEYCGTYYSAELETTYQLSLTGKRLTIHQMRLGEFALEPDIIAKDSFSGMTGTLHFTRGDKNVITGFTLSGGRIRNIRFGKK